MRPLDQPPACGGLHPQIFRAILEARSVWCLRGYTEDMGDMLSLCMCSA